MKDIYGYLVPKFHLGTQSGDLNSQKIIGLYYLVMLDKLTRPAW
jgi:hypothetical protein